MSLLGGARFYLYQLAFGIVLVNNTLIPCDLYYDRLFGWGRMVNNLNESLVCPVKYLIRHDLVIILNVKADGKYLPMFGCCNSPWPVVTRL